MQRKQVAIVDSITQPYVDKEALESEILSDIADVTLIRVSNREELKGRLGKFDAVISWHLIPITKDEIEQLTSCQVIVRAAVGFDNIDIEEAARKGIPVCNVPDYGTEEVADHAFALMLSLARRLPHVSAEIANGTWDWRVVGDLPRLRGKTLGIVGFGRIGSAVARRAMPFGLKVVFYDPYLPDGADKAHGVARVESLDELVEVSDIISIHAPLSPETFHMIGERQFARMSRETILINTARGEIIDQGALLNAWREGRIVKLGLDVLEKEPTIPEELLSSRDVILSAHAAFFSNAGLEELRKKSAHTTRNVLLGKPVRTVLNGAYATTSVLGGGR